MIDINEIIESIDAKISNVPDYEVNPEHITTKYLAEIYSSLHRNNFSFLGAFVGRHRVGKSLTSTLFSTLLDNTFYRDMHLRVVYTPEQFIKAVNYLRRSNIRGGFIIWDEAGVGLPAREWYDIQNKNISYAIQVAGYLNPGFIFVTQDISYIDTQPRKLFQAFYDVSRPGTKYSVVFPYDIIIQRRTGKIYWYRPILRLKYMPDEYSLKIVLSPIEVHKPPKELIEKYEEISKPWKDKILERAEDRVADFEDGKIPKKEMSTDEIIETILKNPSYYETDRSQPGNRKLSADLIRYDFGIPFRLAKVIQLRAQQLLNEKDRSEKDDNSG